MFVTDVIILRASTHPICSLEQLGITFETLVVRGEWEPSIAIKHTAAMGMNLPKKILTIIKYGDTAKPAI